MAQIGLADTLKLLAAGYKKKDIDALAKIDENPAPAPDPDPAPAPDPDPAPAPDPDPAPAPDPDLKAQLEAKQQELDDLLAKMKENEEKLKKIQQENVHKNGAPAALEAKQQEQESLNNLVRSFM